jgi:drug/metabolite transporter, DME family
MTRLSPVLAGTFGVLLAAALFGTSGTSQALLAPDAWPPSVAAVRLLVGAAGLLAFVIWRGYGAELMPLWRRPMAWVMGFAVAAYQGLFFVALSLTGVAIGTLISLACAPFIAGALGWLLREGAPGWTWFVSTLIAIAGLALLTSVGGDGVNVLGVLAAVGAGTSYAVYTVLGGRLTRDGERPSVVMAAPFTIGALFLVPFLFGAGWLLSPSGLVLAVWVGLVATSMAYLLFALALPVLQPGHIATLTLLEPVVATALGVLVLGEVITGFGWFGCGLILIALTLLGVREGRSAGDRHRIREGAVT